jgi:hypothetical protein
MEERTRPMLTVSEIGHVVFAAVVSLLLWAFIRRLDDRRGPPRA